MTQKELIRQEIERLKKWSESSKKEWIDEGYNQNAFAEDCRIKSFDKLLAFIDSLPEEKPSEDLEEAAEEYADKHGFRVPYDGSNNYYDDVDVKASKAGFIAGAEWQREQMLKDAAEGEIVKDITNMLAVTARNINIDGFKFGDKVKIIIIKDND